MAIMSQTIAVGRQRRNRLTIAAAAEIVPILKASALEAGSFFNRYRGMGVRSFYAAADAGLKNLSVAICFVLVSQTAAAAAGCHRYHYWAYKSPQPSCNKGVRLAQSQPQPEPAREVIDPHPSAPAPDDHTWYVEIVLPDADPARTEGVEKLKSLLGRE